MAKTITVTPQTQTITNTIQSSSVDTKFIPTVGSFVNGASATYGEGSATTQAETFYIHNIVDDLVTKYKGNTLNINVTWVTLDKETLAMAPEAKTQLTATVAPTDATIKTVTWASDDEDVATVNATGLVTAVADWTCTITVTTDDGDFTAECDVTVTTA